VTFREIPIAKHFITLADIVGRKALQNHRNYYLMKFTVIFGYALAELELWIIFRQKEAFYSWFWRLLEMIP
jgi:hypothetical protein